MKRRTDKQLFFVGIDIAKASHVARCIDLFSNTVGKICTFGNNKLGFAELFLWLDQISDPASIVIGMEATGHYWKLVHTWLVSGGWEVELINPILTANQSRRQIRGNKTDSIDAVSIAKCVRDADYIPTCIPSAELQGLQELTRMRSDLVTQQTATKIHVNGLLDLVFPEWGNILVDCHVAGLTALLKTAPSAEKIAKLSISDITKIIQKASRGQWKKEKAQAIHACALGSIGQSSTTLEFVLLTHLANREHTSALIAATEKKIAEQLERTSSPLKALPYTGRVGLPCMVAEFGAIERFLTPVYNHRGELTSNEGQMLAFAGLDPRLRESGKWFGKTKMSKRGSGALRSALLRTADTARKNNPFFKAIFEKHQAKGKAHFVCLSHVARKYIQAIYRLMKLGDDFDWDVFTQVKKREQVA